MISFSLPLFHITLTIKENSIDKLEIIIWIIDIDNER